jgi:hypothetical protein
MRLKVPDAMTVLAVVIICLWITGKVADVCVVIPTASQERVTPHTEGLCAVVWHLLISHPALKASQTKWESVRQEEAPRRSATRGRGAAHPCSAALKNSASTPAG